MSMTTHRAIRMCASYWMKRVVACSPRSIPSTPSVLLTRGPSVTRIRSRRMARSARLKERTQQGAAEIGQGKRHETYEHVAGRMSWIRSLEEAHVRIGALRVGNRGGGGAQSLAAGALNDSRRGRPCRAISLPRQKVDEACDLRRGRALTTRPERGEIVRENYI